eukprot:CAMPEP_0206250952 /NCGR_PEP_ID=MMETSP0047_2-20121206/21757_1 /ASSEMBLY_ACC=CAM_ASM_000192 /TAXON_ID=195065 /ORGANISM="Chroomonas mesostigmatica_cf, Strain CCMP1168" /LENGTH=125 /DNA_ID=CAMNT_0053676857 /DNA_START=374 /DNA_END=748 /DNA_ORIENTATION=+
MSGAPPAGREEVGRVAPDPGLRPGDGSGVEPLPGIEPQGVLFSSSEASVHPSSSADQAGPDLKPPQLPVLPPEAAAQRALGLEGIVRGVCLQRARCALGARICSWGLWEAALDSPYDRSPIAASP